MIPAAPNQFKSRLDSTLLVDQNQRVLPYFGVGSIIQPVSIVDCAPNTGFLPVLKDYATQYVFGDETNGVAGDGVSIEVLEDGIYDVHFFVADEIFSTGLERFDFALRATLGGTTFFRRRVALPGDGSQSREWRFAAYAQAGNFWQLSAVAAFTGGVEWGITAIPRSL